MTKNSNRPRGIGAAATDLLHREARLAGFNSVDVYVEELISASHKGYRSVIAPPAPSSTRSVFKTELGEMLCGNSLSWLSQCQAGSVDLVVTSPPFSLVRKKAYGNFDKDSYISWFLPFAHEIHRVLADHGSFVVDFGGAWVPGLPVKNIYNFKLLVEMVETVGFYLAQDHYWWNPSRLPTPAQWVNVERVRVKDAVNTVWWLSKTPHPYASNKKVLQPYSPSMERSLQRGYGVAGKTRPSGHKPSDAFSLNNGGSIPPNLLAISNSSPRDHYTEYCNVNGVPIHPARFPAKLPEYFIRMLTSRNGLVVDPFAGSCVTGAVAESLNRRWVCIDLKEEYLRGAVGRFVQQDKDKEFGGKAVTYEISAPSFKRYRKPA